MLIIATIKILFDDISYIVKFCVLEAFHSFTKLENVILKNKAL